MNHSKLLFPLPKTISGILAFMSICAVFLYAGLAFAAQNNPVITVEIQSSEYVFKLATPGKSGIGLVNLNVYGKNGIAATQLVLSGELWMPEMDMPGYPVALEFKEEGNGRYAALVQYAHGGQWRIGVTLKRDKEQLLQQQFDFLIEN